MKPEAPIALNFLVEAVGSPGVGEEGNRHRLAVAVELQSANSDRVHHRRIVHDLDLDP